MAKETELTQDGFDSLLNWLDLNRDLAGRRYETIRSSLIRIFIRRGCSEAEELADATMDRVIRKLPEISDGYVGEPERYFYKVAGMIHLEWLRNTKKLVELSLETPAPLQIVIDDTEYACLESCLSRLTAAQRMLIVGYHQDDGSAKIERRRALAATLELSANALQVRAHRLRLELAGCVRNCTAANGE